MQILLKGGRLVDPPTGRDDVVDILVVDGRIERLGKDLAASGAQSIDLRGRVMAPGFLDMHVHLREPGFEHKETILTGVQAAAAGGFTAVCCMPNTNPPIDDESVIRFIQSRARVALNGAVDVYPIAAVTSGRKGEHLGPLAELAEAGAVGFSDDGDPVGDAEIMRRALEYAAMFDRPIIQHAQDVAMTRGSVMHEGLVATSLGLQGWPSIAEEIIVARDIMLTEYTHGRYHVAHASTAGTIDLVRRAKARSLPVTCEVTPHHFSLTDELVRSFDTNTKMNPPLRPGEHVEAIREGIKDGTIDAIASDHAPHSFDEKEVEFQAAPFGIVGLETAVGLAMTELVHTNLIGLPRLIELMAVNPRRILRLPDVAIEEGATANLTILDPSKEWVVDPSRFRSRSRNTPFAGRRLKGRPLGIINNAQAIWAD